MKPNPNRKPMTSCERGAWIDAESTISIVKRRGRIYGKPVLAIYQREREPLEDYCKGAEMDGVQGCRVVHVPRRDMYRAEITATKQIAKEIALTKNA